MNLFKDDDKNKISEEDVPDINPGNDEDFGEDVQNQRSKIHKENLDDVNNFENANSDSKEPYNPLDDTGISSFTTLIRFFGVAVQPEQVAHILALNKNISKEEIILISKELDLKAKISNIEIKYLLHLPLPAIVELKSGEFVILAHADKNSVLMLKHKEKSPTVASLTEFENLWSGNIILVSQKFLKDSKRAFGFKWFIPDIIKYKKPLIEVLVAALTLQILGLFSPIITQVVIDKVLTHHSFSTLNVMSIGLLLIVIFETVMGIARTYLFTHTTSRIDVMLGARLFKHLFSLPFTYFETRRVGDTVSRVRELENIRQFLTGTPLTIVLDVVFVIVYIFVMLVYSKTLTVTVILSLPIFAILSLVVTPLFKERLDERFYHGAEQNSYLVETVTGVQTIKAFALESQIQKKWEGILSNYVKSSFKTSILAGVAGNLGQFIQKVFDILILWMGAHLVISGKMSVGQLVAFRMLSGRVSGPILRMVQMWQDFQQAGLSVRRLGDIFNTKPEPTVEPSKSSFPNIKGDISFEDVTFRYKADAKEVISNMSFDIKAGSVVGIVGRSGSGKSTISKLVQRLYIAERGKILVDGIDLSLADPIWLRRQIGVVLQENFLFNATVRENICIHKSTATMEEIMEVSKIAGAHEFILELQEGYETMIGEKGTGLSGGQKQRIAIARALLCNPRILIFDEATSALDYESESIIQKNLKAICKNRTVIIIAHRLSTLKDADYIMTVDKGKLVEFGTRDELLESKGLFYYLNNQQENREIC